MYHKKNISLTTIFAVVLVFGLMSGLNSCAPAEDEIHLGYVLWDSEIASTHVVAAILEDELHYNVRLTSVDAGPMWTGLARGDFDAIVAAWLPATHEAYLEQTSDRVIDLGPNLDGAKIGWVVPAYVPVNSIDELNDYIDEFNGQIVGIDPGAGLMRASDAAIDEYELNYNLVEGSDAAMTAALSRAYEREEWIIITGWIPHWKFASYDLKFLDDPLGVFGEAESIHTIVNPELAETAPEVYAFLDNFYWSPDDMGDVMVMIEEGLEPYDAARVWIAGNLDKIAEWLP